MNARNARTIGSILATILVIAAGGDSARAADHAHVLRLSWLNANDAFTLPFGPMAEEVDEAFEPHDVTVSWEAGADASRELRVMLLPVEPTVWNVPANAMGITRGDVGTSNTVYIFLPTVMRALGLDMAMRRMPSAIEKRRIAVALGRVISHEVFHALLFDQPHAKHGLMREQLTKSSLSAGESHFDVESAAALRDALEAGL